MFVERFTWKTERGHELFALLQEVREQFPPAHTRRIYRCKFGGTYAAVAQEDEWESFDEHDRVWSEWTAKPEWAGFGEKLGESAISEVSREIWTLAE